ncbi:MAG: hypothetical protein JSV23_04210, partial [Promethearchaeota archaeon]
EGKPVTIELNLDLYYWAENVVKEEKWDNFSDLINVSLKYFKDNYSEIIKEIKKFRLERLEKKKTFEKAIKEEDNKRKKVITEDEIIEKVPGLVRKKEDLEDIMSALGDITGEKYEISINLNEEEVFEEKSSLGYTDEDIKEFEKVFAKKAIWHEKPTKAFKNWLKNENKS